MSDPASIRAQRAPRRLSSRATAHPTAPAPTTATSKGPSGAEPSRSETLTAAESIQAGATGLGSSVGQVDGDEGEVERDDQGAVEAARAPRPGEQQEGDDRHPGEPAQVELDQAGGPAEPDDQGRE